ncbi:carbohydrate kinase [Vallitalea longa]|uniref:Carbohydrate kinase n=1 Tax=Vallitalea longa TaxID=2936439 RepID=A0A9W5Y8G3_9FIRM|nr:FGGY-family carbohydrate kinase [Vallitalea longa]GKX27668.1 carbohydrate kinase [Vallitalea longa]
MEKYFIGIDSGTTSIKAVLFNLKGKEIAKKAFALTGIFPKENQYEEDMYEIWGKAKLCIKDITSRYSKDNIVGIGITAQGDGLWMVDENIEPVRNGCCFCDGRASEFVDEWVKDGTCDKLFELTGTRIFTGNQNGIVRWMEKYEKENLDKSKHLLHLKDYLFYKFTGEITTDATDQSLIMINQKDRTYMDEAFKICGIEKYRDKYPPIKSAKENAFHILGELADELKLNKDVIVTSGPMDVGACALGSGVIQKGHCCSIIGTAALHEMVIDEPLKDNIKAGMTVAHVMEGKWLRLMASLAGTPNLEWMLNTIGKQIIIDAKEAGDNVYSYMEKVIESVPIGSRGIMYHPYLLAGGERAPFTDSRARASYTGISVKHTLDDIIRATYEGVAFAMLDCYQHMPLNIEQVTICGGGAKSNIWCQMFADVLGKKIITVKGEELGAKGVIINNAIVQGFYKDYLEAVEETVEVNKIFEPNIINQKKYMEYYGLYKRTYQVLQETWKLREKLIKKEW